MARDLKTGIQGVYVLSDDTTEANVKHWKNEMKVLYEASDQYGKPNEVEYTETTNGDGSRYINFWISA